MQRLSGVLLILAGAALGAYSYLLAPQNGAEKLAEVTRISAAPDRVVTSSISPSVKTPAIAPPTRNDDGTRVFSNATPLTPIAGEASSAETARAPASAWSTVVTTEPAAQMQKLTSPKPGDAQTRTVLTSDLQRELKRVGCYAGEVNGAWTPSTQRAMSAFMERVNATLPTAEPDYILLTLVQGHTATACGAECPSGEVMTAGRCVPQAVVAQATRKSQRAEERRVAPAWMQGKSVRGDHYLTRIAIPNFYFHATTAYAILRHAGVTLGKPDFLMHLGPPNISGDAPADDQQ